LVIAHFSIFKRQLISGKNLAKILDLIYDSGNLVQENMIEKK